MAQIRSLTSHVPLSLDVPQVDDRRVLMGIIYVICHGLQWRDAPLAYGSHKTLFIRFVRILAAFAADAGQPEPVMIGNTHLTVHRTASSLLKMGLFPDLSGLPRAG